MFKTNVKLHNRFDFEVIDAITGEVKQRATSYNIVLNTLYTRLINRQTHMQSIHLGSGTGVLDAARTSLFTFVVGRTGSVDSTSMSIYNLYRRIKIQLAPEEYVDTTFTEVGVAYSTGSTSLLTHSLLLDSEGNPITITKTGTDIIVVYATMFFTFTLPDNVRLCHVNAAGIASTLNSVINYLVNDTTSISTNISIGDIAADINDSYIYSYINGGTGFAVASSLSADAVNNRIVAASTRFSVSAGNSNVQEVTLLDSFNFSLLDGIYAGTTYTDVPLSGQDGTQTRFRLPSNNIDSSTLTIKVNGVSVAYSIIDVPYLSKINNGVNSAGLSGARPGIHSNVFNHKFYATSNASAPLNHYINTQGVRTMKVTTQTTSLNEVTLAYISDNYILHKDKLYDRSGTLIKNFAIPNWTDYGQGLIFPSENRLAIAVCVNAPRVMTICDKDGEGNWNITAQLAAPGPYSSSSTDYTTARGFAITPDENTIVCIGQDSPYVVSYTFDGAAWNADTFTGLSLSARANAVSISPDGTMLLVNSRLSTRNQLFVRSGTSWVRDETFPVVNCLGSYFIDNDTIMAIPSGVASPITYMSYIKRIDNAWIDLTSIANIETSLTYSYVLTSAMLTPFDNYIGIHYMGSQDVNTGSCQSFLYSMDKTMKIAILETAPLATDEVKATYTVKGIHKTNQYVLDVGGYVQFGG